MRFVRVFGLLGLSLTLSACNLFGGIDSPSGDQQLLSAARAAFDQGNYSQALNYYQQLSGNESDIKLSETAYLAFNQAGGTIQNFAAAFGNGKNINIGPALANFATALKSYAGAANRIAVFNAFNTALAGSTPIQDPNIKYMVEFLGSLTMAGLVLAEDIGNDSEYHTYDVCPTAGTAPCTQQGVLLGANVVSGAGGNVAGDMLGAALSDFNASPGNLEMFNAAILDVFSAITSLGASGAFGSGFSSIQSALNTLTPTAGAGALQYRAAMVTVGIGL
jgi:hypothetical protein